MVVERQADVEELLDLESGKAKLVLAVHEDSDITSVKQFTASRSPPSSRLLPAHISKNTTWM